MARDCPQGSSWLRYARILYPKISSLFLLAIGICHLGNQIHGKRSSRKTYSHTLMRPKYKASGSGDRNESPVRFFFFLFRPILTEVPLLQVESELQLLAYTTATSMPDPNCICALHHGSQKYQILNPLSEARDRTHSLMDANVGFSTH